MKKAVHWEPPKEQKDSIPSIVLSEFIESPKKPSYPAFPPPEDLHPPIYSRLCKRLSLPRSNPQPLDPQHDLAFDVNFEANKCKYTLIDEYLSSGLGTQFSKLSTYNTLRYSKNSPFG